MKAQPGTVPEQWATHKLVSIAARLDERRLNRRLAKLGLTTGSLDALETTAELESTTATGLAEMLCVSRQSLGKVLRRLQNLGFLTKEPGRDGRSADIRLTAEGRAVLSAAGELIHEGTEAEAPGDALFRRQLEKHILRLRNSERTTAARHTNIDRQKKNSTTTGATTWRQPTAPPDPKPPFKKQPRQ
jgi:DNA-binding MarR family transcriptional regulator